jgi:hypothetical protein
MMPQPSAISERVFAVRSGLMSVNRRCRLP